MRGDSLVALEFDTRRAPVRASQYLELVKAVRSASAADELDWLEWKSMLTFRPKDKADKSARAHLARAIIGFANRQPDVALRNAEGHAFLVVGVDPAGYHGVDEIDSVELERWITPYVGEEIDWRTTYVHVGEEGHDRLPILIVTVSPPRWGDPIFCIRKEIPSSGKDTIPEAAIFVRRPGRTDRARAADLDRLAERLLRKHQALDLSLAVQDGAMTPVITPDEAVDRLIEAERERLVSQLPTPSPESGVMALESAMNKFAAGTKPDPRSREKYLEEVEGYLTALREAIPQTLPDVAAHAATRTVLRLHNHTHTHLKDVQIRLELPAEILAVPPADLDERDRGKPFPRGVPKPPRVYGPMKRTSFPAPLHNLVRGSAVPAYPLNLQLPAGQEIEMDGATVVFPPEDVRVGLSVDLVAFVAVTQQPLPGPLPLSWTATATNMEGTAEGTLDLPVEPVQSLFHLIAAVTD
jgi:hypothetical protein